jgi:hypothetical protein
MRPSRVFVAGESMPGKTRMLLLNRQLDLTCLLVSLLVDAWTLFCVYMGI